MEVAFQQIPIIINIRGQIENRPLENARLAGENEFGGPQIISHQPGCWLEAMIWKLFWNLTWYIDDNENNMTFEGHIAYLRPL